MASAVMFSLTLLAGSNDNVTGSSEDPNAVTAEKNSSSATPILCKVGGDWGDAGCAPEPGFSEGDLYSEGDRIVKTNVHASDSAWFGKRAGEIFFETDSIEGGKTRAFI